MGNAIAKTQSRVHTAFKCNPGLHPYFDWELKMHSTVYSTHSFFCQIFGWALLNGRDEGFYVCAKNKSLKLIQAGHEKQNRQIQSLYSVRHQSGSFIWLCRRLWWQRYFYTDFLDEKSILVSWFLSKNHSKRRLHWRCRWQNKKNHTTDWPLWPLTTLLDLVKNFSSGALCICRPLCSHKIYSIL